MATSFRVDRRNGYMTLIDAFKADYNTTAVGKAKIIQTYRSRPATFHTPSLYIGLFAEPSILHREGIRTRIARDQLVLVQGQYDNAQAADRQDDLVDEFIDWLTANPSAAGANTVTEPVSTEDVELAIGPTSYLATIVSVTSDIAEGRN